MKTSNVLNFLGATLVFGFVACNNDSGNTDSASADTNTENNTATTTTTSTGSYAAQADSFRTNSDAGNYLDARTGKPIKINVNPETGNRTNAETGEPIWRYIDRRNWWVYGGESWDTVGTARMENNQLRYRGNNDRWITYDERWKSEDDKLMNDWKIKHEKNETTLKSTTGDTKIEIEKDGDTKIKTEDSKLKTDEDGTKVRNK